MSGLLHVHTAEEVTGGNVKVDYKFGDIPIINETLDLCTVTEQGGLTCPLTKETQTLIITKEIPSGITSVSQVCISTVIAI